jgi:hypothetical protein
MIKMVESLGDRLLARLVPHVTAKAEPCECSGVWSRQLQCHCYCYVSVRQTQSCSGCRLSYSSCDATNYLCIAGNFCG